VKKGLLSKKTTTTRIESDQELVLQATVSGDTVNLISDNNTSLLGVNAVSTNGLTINSGGDIAIGALEQNSRELEDVKVKKSGFSIGSGGLFIGSSRVENEDGIKTTTNVGSLVGSSNGDVTGVVDIQGRSIHIENDIDLVETRSTSESKSVGVTIGLQSPLLSGAQTLNRLTEIGTQTDNARTAAVAAVAGGLAAKNTIDAFNKDPKALGGVTISASIGFSKSQSENRTSDETRLETTGNLTALADGAIAFRRAVERDTTSGSSSSSGASLGVSASFGTGLDKGKPGELGFGAPTIGANFNSSSSEFSGEDITNIETVINVGGTATIGTPGALTLDGATLSARQVVIDARSLDILSRQDTSTFESSNSSTGVGVSVALVPGPNSVSGSLNIGKGEQSGNFASVQEQAGIFAGEGGFDINIEDATDLTGAVIASEADDARNRLNTGSLTFRDIENSEEFNASQSNIGLSLSIGGQKSETGTDEEPSVTGDGNGGTAVGGNRVPGIPVPGLKTAIGVLAATLPSTQSASGRSV